MRTRPPFAVRVLAAGAGAAVLLAGCAQVSPPRAQRSPSASIATSTPPVATTPAATPAGTTPATPVTTSPATAPATTPVQSPTTPASPTTTPTAPASQRVNCAKTKCIAISFDDGPSAQSGELLDTLKAKNVKATFFVIGNLVKLYPQLVQRMLSDGHVVGNHSYTHPQFWHLSANAIKSEIDRTSQEIKRATGQQVRLMRPPYGQTNPTVRRVLRQLGLAQILWSVDTLDWKYRNTKTVIANALKPARRGAIILLHEIYPTTRAAVATIIDGLRAKGYTLVTIPELLGKTRPGVSYSQR